MLLGMNLWPLASTRITLTAQPWWHRSPFCHTSLIASPHSAHLYSFLIPLRLVSVTSLTKRHFSSTVSEQVTITKCLSQALDSHKEQLPGCQTPFCPKTYSLVCARANCFFTKGQFNVRQAVSERRFTFTSSLMWCKLFQNRFILDVTVWDLWKCVYHLMFCQKWKSNLPFVAKVPSSQCFYGYGCLFIHLLSVSLLLHFLWPVVLCCHAKVMEATWEMAAGSSHMIVNKKVVKLNMSVWWYCPFLTYTPQAKCCNLKGNICVNHYDVTISLKWLHNIFLSR